ncbi:MAG: DNA/RNA helicase [Candidatus Methylumidiphilus alinenensis]|uniref:DNA/RNA helicase n=1 Tax=Candidatus Methylumidiphilus alinenensis TaxID=2202197 RepID=A0A2W4QKA3_9GAMM|nr:MAG: DNA/RNA helicase [Candidatus Methylumidiphilus alinenensis]
MSVIIPKQYQKEAVNQVLYIFRHTESQLQQVQDEDSQRTATAFNGNVLLEAPTGAGKTLMAGLIAETFSRPDHRHNAKIVWLWFTPFANLVEQAKGSLKADFTGLRVRDLACERIAYSTKSGDVFVTTWASVAARNADSRRLRKNGDLSLSLDQFIVELRQAGFRIGVVVDEAHHGFTHETEAMRFYRETMKPDFTLLITATPDDADIEKFKKAAGMGELHRFPVSRKDAVDAGLIKPGVKSIAYLASDDHKALADIPGTALAEGWQTHQAIKAQLVSIGVNLTPLMLVQVANKGKDGANAIEEARAKLEALGVPNGAIASYTADEPTDDLLVVALDESKEVLLFKMAVAMGFDAPRAFTVVSLRGASDVDFGIQVVGRILRVHRKLQPLALNQTLPEPLRFGYVFLADYQSQSGLIKAGDKINTIQTKLSAISDNALVVRVAGEAQVQFSQNGQMSLLSYPYNPPPWKPLTDEGKPISEVSDIHQAENQALPGFDLFWGQLPLTPKPSDSQTPTKPQPGNTLYKLKENVPTQFQTEYLPSSTDELLKKIGAYRLEPEVLAAGLRKTVKITRKTIEDIFGKHEEKVDSIQGKLSKRKLALQAQRVLFDAKAINPREAETVLLERLRLEYNIEGGQALLENELRQALYLILATYPHLLKDAERASLASCREVIKTASLPPSVEMLQGALLSRLSIYGVMPQDMNEPERKFAELLDADTSGTVVWWHRNEPRKPWSVALVLPGGERYFPDFIIAVKDRIKGGGLMLAEIKGDFILDNDDTREKARAEHKIYGSPLLLTQKANGQFWIARYIAKTNRVERDQAFRVEHLGQY